MRPVAPVRRFADAVRATIDLVARCGVGGQDVIALTLAAAGWNATPAEALLGLRPAAESAASPPRGRPG